MNELIFHSKQNNFTSAYFSSNPILPQQKLEVMYLKVGHDFSPSHNTYY